MSGKELYCVRNSFGNLLKQINLFQDPEDLLDLVESVVSVDLGARPVLPDHEDPPDHLDPEARAAPQAPPDPLETQVAMAPQEKEAPVERPDPLVCPVAQELLVLLEGRVSVESVDPVDPLVRRAPLGIPDQPDHPDREEAGENVDLVDLLVLLDLPVCCMFKQSEMLNIDSYGARNVALRDAKEKIDLDAKYSTA